MSELPVPPKIGRVRNAANREDSMRLNVSNAEKITAMTARFFDGTGFISGGSGHGNVGSGQKADAKRFNIAKGIVSLFRSNMKGKDAIELGEALIKQHSAKGTIAGNCGEMACVAATLVLSHHQAADTEIYCIVQQAKNFGHQYCLVQAGGVGNGTIDAGAIVLDPWFEVATTFGNYKAAVTLKLDDWLKDGFRINTGKGWRDPKHQDVLDVLDATPQPHPCREKI